MAFKTYYTALADLLQCENELLVQMDKDSAKLELSGDNASSHEQLKKSCSDLYYFLSILAELLDLQPPAKDGTITESVDVQPRAKDFTTWLAEVWPNHFIPIDLRPSVQADVLGEAAHTSDEQSAKEKDNTSEAYTVPLPFDVMRKILSRCEVEDLVRFRTVNKEINAYNYKLLMHQALEFFIRVDNNHTVQIMNPGTRVLRELETPEDFRGAGAVSSMVHCKGLVLCSFMDAKLAIWNPVLIKARWINPPSGGFTNFDFYGLGYNEPSPDSYKVLRFIHRAQFQNSHFSGDDIQQAEIYEFGTDSWKTVEAKRDWIIESWSKGLSINGRMYWVAWKRLQESSKPVAFILSFDFSTEEFKSIVDCPNNGKGTLRLGSFERDRLSLIQQSVSTRVIEVWVTESNLESFTRKFTMSARIPNLQRHFSHPVYTLGKNNGVMAWCLVEAKAESPMLFDKFVFCELYEEGGLGFESTIVNEREGGDVTLNVGYLYFPSLVPLPIVGSTPTTYW
ncbi:unnamed protein product [Brassica oleracea]|uniref:(rape) hypothetical protein n=1 Tax=Brassica napus TaxID=3708 RepID=A0A816LKT4_BRANA|nr:unnamed protein product [Brassica napus]